MQRLRVLSAAGILAFVTLGSLRAAAPAAPSPPAASPRAGSPAAAAAGRAAPGSALPATRVPILRPGAKEAVTQDLAALAGKRPLLICYFAAGEPLGEETLLQVQEKARGPWAGKVEVLGAVRSGSAADVAERLGLLGIELPAVLDEGFDLGRMLGATTSPSLTLMDASGILRIADARSLKQEVSPGVRMADAVDTAARGGAVQTIFRLPRYYPVTELVGEAYPDFMLKRFRGTERVKLSDRLVPGAKKILAVLFWHPNCKHCKQQMPGIVSGYETYKDFIDLVSVVALKNEDEARNAADTIQAHRMRFPVLEDEGRRISELYKVNSTPTMVFIRPDGIVDSAYTSGDVNYVPIFSAKLRSILGQPSHLRGSRPAPKP